MEFVNLEKFKAFLDENVKAEWYSFDAYLNDLVKDLGSNGSTNYELSPFETKSGRPEIYRYEYRLDLDDDGDVVDERIIF